MTWLAIVLGVGSGGLVALILLLWWSRERTRRVLLEHMLSQQQQDRQRNETANAHLQEKHRTRAARVGTLLDPADPWRGVRESAAPIDGAALRPRSAPRSGPGPH